MLLSVQERILILNCLPQEENIITLRVLRDLRKMLSFTEEEHKEFGFTFQEDRVSWKQNTDKEIEIGDIQANIIKESLRRLDSAKKLTEAHISLWEKFIEAK